MPTEKRRRRQAERREPTVNLHSYLDRVGFEGKPRPDLDTLSRLHRGHVENIPYENLDVQFARPLTRDPAASFDKLVTGAAAVGATR